MGLSPLKFTGVSTFSDDFQTILSRAVSIAQLPLKSLQNQDSDLIQKKQIAADLSSAVAGLASSLTILGTIGANGALDATSSDTSEVSIVSATASTPGTYTISDLSLAKAASETSLTGYADDTAVSASGTMTLTVGQQSYTISLGSGQNNLAGLRDAINNLNAGVTATVLTTGTGATPNYLLVNANGTGANTLKLVEGTAGADFLTKTNQGADASFLLNNIPVSQSSNLVNSVVPGVTFQLNGATLAGQSVTLSLAPDGQKISNALQNFATSYNAVRTKLNAQTGSSAGLLSGDTLISGMRSLLRQVVNFNGTGDIKSLSDLGIEMSDSGEMSFNQDTFNRLSSAQIGAACQFLGSATSGFGGLSQSFTQYSDPISGLIAAQVQQYDAADRRIQDQISALNDRITQMQAGLSLKLQQADALISQLQSQQSVLTSSIQSLTYTSFGDLSALNGNSKK